MVFLPHAKDAIPILPSSAEMFVLQHLRDEAHRFAISFHRRRRGKLTLRSALADVPGIGPGRQRALLRHFGSLKKIRDATLEELTAVPGVTAAAAAAVFAQLGKGASAGAPADAPAQAGDDDAEDEVLENAFAEIEDESGADDPPLDAEDPTNDQPVDADAAEAD
jgi:excinuclease ABC subunit C